MSVKLANRKFIRVIELPIGEKKIRKALEQALAKRDVKCVVREFRKGGFVRFSVRPEDVFVAQVVMRRLRGLLETEAGAVRPESACCHGACGAACVESVRAEVR